jgi:hypothetical protein
MSEWLLHAMLGGAERDRTAGLLVANEALSQLSYSPTGDSPILSAMGIGEKGGKRLLLVRPWRTDFAGRKADPVC